MGDERRGEHVARVTVTMAGWRPDKEQSYQGPKDVRALLPTAEGLWER